MIKYTECYQVVTEESAEQGDFAEHGFALPGRWKFALADSEGYHEDILEGAKQNEYQQKGTLADLVRLVRNQGLTFNGSWFEMEDADIDYATGESTTYSLHVRDDRAMRAIQYAITNNLKLW